MALDPSLTEFTTASPILANYDYNDLAEGTGNVEFYGGTTKELTVVNHILRRGTFFSNWNNRFTQAAVTGGNAKRIDLDFDLSAFKNAQVINGTGYVYIPVINAGNCTSYAIARVRKVSATGAESEIASATSETTNTLAEHIFAMALTIPKTPIATGETLRVTIEIWALSTSGNTHVGLAHDSNGGDCDFPSITNSITAGNSYLKVNIPFEINL